MARTGVTYQEVELQANTLMAKGNNPTLEKIRRALGDRGSNSTLSKHLNHWRERQSKQQINPLSRFNAQNSPLINSTAYNFYEENAREVQNNKGILRDRKNGRNAVDGKDQIAYFN